ncbi:MAG: SUMF1/EgtB/PvdO family nonheme iron enzyme [Pseudomonadota bacterium]
MITTNLFIIVSLVSVLAAIGLMAWVIDAGVSESKKAYLQYGLFAMLACVFGLFFLIDDDSEFEYAGYEKSQKGKKEQKEEKQQMGEAREGQDRKVVGEDKGGETIAGDTDITIVDAEDTGEPDPIKSDSDCDLCPEIVEIAPGTGLLGSPVTVVKGGVSTGPAFTVTLRKPFGIGRNEISVAEFRYFVEETGYKPSSSCRVGRKVLSGRSFLNPGFKQQDENPAVCVSWTDAQRYVDWLSKKTGRRYKLPSEIEWEFAARSGVSGRFISGETISITDANYRAPGRRAPTGTVAAGASTANSSGMYHVHGNAWEFVADCWSPAYYQRKQAGTQKGQDCSRRIVKGGGWFSSEDHLNLAMRARVGANSASNGIGFRVVRLGRRAPDGQVTVRDYRGMADGRERAGLTSKSKGGEGQKNSSSSKPQNKTDGKPSLSMSGGSSNDQSRRKLELDRSEASGNIGRAASGMRF